MKTNGVAKNGLYIGFGAGLVLFAVLGLLPGSFIGGVIGLNIAGRIFGSPLEASILPRTIVALSMLSGVMLSALIFTACCTVTGWLAGHLIDSIHALRQHSVATALKGK